MISLVEDDESFYSNEHTQEQHSTLAKNSHTCKKGGHHEKDQYILRHQEQLHHSLPVQNISRNQTFLSKDKSDMRMDSLSSKENHRKGYEGREKSPYSCTHCNICNHSNEGNATERLPWDEIKIAAVPRDTNNTSCAIYIEQDVIGKQRKEIMLLMDELSARDKELNDLVRSHQTQVKAWEVDRNKLKDLQERLSSYEKDLQKSDQQLQLTMEEMKHVSVQKEIDEQELLKTRNDMEKLSQKISENSLYLRELEGQNKNLMGSVKDLVKVKGKMENKVKDLESHLESKASEMKKMMEKNKIFECRLHQADEANHNFKAEISTWKNKYCMARDESDRLTEENARKDGNIQHLTVQLHETLQQTLALQKSLFNSCEREKCKEELLISQRKQQERTMQQLSSLQSLYEKQTKDLTVYHLSVQGSGHSPGERDSKESPVTGQDDRNDWTEEEERRPEGCDRNMSYCTSKPNFLKYETRGKTSTFLLKTKLLSKGSQSPNEDGSRTKGKCDEMKNCVVSSDGTGSTEGCDRILKANEEACKGDGKNRERIVSGKRNGIHRPELGSSMRSKTQSSELQRRIANSSSPILSGEHQKRSLSSSNEDLFNRSSHPKQNSRSKSSSPPRMQERGTSPISDLAQEFNVEKGHNVDNVRNRIYLGHCLEDRGSSTMETKEKKRKDRRHDRFEPTKKMHNETSGVYLSSSECSTLSLSEDKIMDGELTPADSDGMCRELKKEYLPKEDESLHSYHGRHIPRNPLTPPTILLRSTPTSENQRSFSTTVKRRRSNENSSPSLTNNKKGSTVNQENFTGHSSQAKEDQEQDTPIKRERCGEIVSTSSPILRKDVSSSEPKRDTSFKWRYRDKIVSKTMPVSWNDNDSYSPKREDEKTDQSLADGSSQEFSSWSKGATCSTDYSVQSDRDVSNTPTNETNGQFDQKSSSNDIESINSSSSGIGLRFSSKNHTGDIPVHESNQNLMESFVISRDREDRTIYRRESNDGEREIKRVDFQKYSRSEKNTQPYSRSVRILSPQNEEIHEGQKVKSNPWKKDENHQHSDNDTLHTDSKKASHENHHNFSSHSSKSILLSGSKIRTNSLPQKDDSGCKLDNSFKSYSPNKETEAQDMKTDNMNMNHGGRREYFYEEYLNSDSEERSSKKMNKCNEKRYEKSAYVKSFPNPSRPFASTKAPSLYKFLSTIHFSDKSRRYEWITPEALQGSGNEENNQQTIQEDEKGTSSVSCLSDDETRATYSISDKTERSYWKTSNSNGNCNIPVGGEESVLDHSQPPSSYVDTLVIEQSLTTTNMDKFHHHFNNIVKKLNFSNLTLTDDGNMDLKESSQNNNMPDFIEEKRSMNNENTMQTLEFGETSCTNLPRGDNAKLNEENSSVVDDNIVKKLDFSVSTSVDKSNFENVLDSNSFNIPVSCDHHGVILSKMNIPLQCVEDPGLNLTSQIEESVNVENNDNKTQDFKEINVDNENSQLCSENQSVQDIGCNDDLKHCENAENSLCHRKVSIPLENHEKLDHEVVAVTSLPDYFPDISSVMADDSSNGEEEMKRQDDPMTCDRGQDRCDNDDTFERCNISLDITPPSSLSPHSKSKPYSQTSTPTRKPTNTVYTNDLNSPGNKYHDSYIKTCTVTKVGSSMHTGDTTVKDCKDDVDSMNEFKIERCEQDYIQRTMGSKISPAKDKMEKVMKERKASDFEGSFLLVSGKLQQWYQQYEINTKTHSPEKVFGNPQFQDKKYVIVSHSDDKNAIKELKTESSNCRHSSEDRYKGVQCPDTIKPKQGHPGGSKDTFEDRLSTFLELEDSSVNENQEISQTSVPMSPASKLHHLLVESQEMIRSLEKSSALKKSSQ